MRSLTLRPSVSSTAGSMPQGLPFPLGFISHNMVGRIQREKVWSCPVRQDRAVHRRSEACMAGAQLASLPWLTVDLPGFPSPFLPSFSFWMYYHTFASKDNSMLKAYKYRLNPTSEQISLMEKTFGSTRFIYNWALQTKIEAY